MIPAEKFDGMICECRRHCRSGGRAGKRGGFTLIELLVVVAIIALLMAVLVPSLSRAKEQGKTMRCSTNLRQIGQIVQIYANDHDGRGPGHTSGISPVAGAFFNSASWGDILNREVLYRGMWGVDQSADGGPNDYSIQAGHSRNYSGKTLSCPNFQPVPYTRPWGYNFDANGGVPDKVTGVPVYGLQTPPPPPFVIPGPSPQTITYDGPYYLGAKLSRFRTSQFLIREFDVSDDTTDWSTCTSAGGAPTTGNGSVILGGGGSYGAPAYSSAITSTGTPIAGEVSFRHPYKKKGTFLCFDDHVDLLTPKDDVFSTRTTGLPKAP